MEWCAMDRLKSVSLWYLAALAMLSLSGCGWWGGQTDRDGEEDADDRLDDPVQAVAVSSTPASPPPKPELDLKVGDRFRLLKTVKQTLQQPSLQGWAVSRSVLEILMSVSI